MGDEKGAQSVRTLHADKGDELDNFRNVTKKVSGW